MSSIAVCGNHQVVYCTEAELAWTLEDMGHTVTRLQENKDSAETMLAKCKAANVQLFIYIHTHGWKTPGQMTLMQLFAALKAEGIKTAGFHLDRYWGLHGDNREERVGTHPFWKTDRVFTADGGAQERFEERGVAHTWLPPGVAIRHCFRGSPQKDFPYDVIFVGARHYHREYPFRMQLIAWLEQTYGSKFRRFAGDAVGGVVRERALNDLYASAPIIVGDSCFGGAPYYWSDRVPETLGRGGFLIHPASKGLEIPGLVTFKAGNLESLKNLIQYYLVRPEVRLKKSTLAMEAVRERHTYHHRMQTVLDVMEVV